MNGRVLVGYAGQHGSTAGVAAGQKPLTGAPSRTIIPPSVYTIDGSSWKDDSPWRQLVFRSRV